MNLLVDYSQIVSYVLIGVMVVILIVSIVLMNRRAKKRQQEAQDLIDAVKPGNKVKTIGGICGIVVEVDREEDTFVLETGTETSGKCYIKFVRQAIFESDATLEKAAPAAEDTASESAPETEAGKELAGEDNAEPAATEAEKPEDKE
ncbi:MAG: preprotein translocase subunit YajC [Roseburia sp.]|nr:preprotein translocase subunit YajC [Roseburia sp.]